MNIDTPLRRLGSIHVAALTDAVLTQPESAWQENRSRQEEFDVHRSTESIVLLFADVGQWPRVVVNRECGWDRLAGVAGPLMDAIVAAHYPPGGTIIRAMAARLRAGARIAPHVDQHDSFHRGHRIHVPVTTNTGVRFTIDGRPYHFEVGEAYEINNQCMHSVMNRGREDRITFIFDYVPPEQLERLRLAS